MIVYCVSRNPIGTRYRKKKRPLFEPPLKPELLIRLPNTKLKFWWLSGTKMSRPMITAVPTTCHQTETLLITASRWVLKMLRITVRRRMIRKSPKVSARMWLVSPKFTPKIVTW